MSVHRNVHNRTAIRKNRPALFQWASGRQLSSFLGILGVGFLAVFLISPQVSSGSLEAGPGDPQIMLETAFVEAGGKQRVAEMLVPLPAGAFFVP